MSDLFAVIAAEAGEVSDDDGDVMTACVSTQILWDADNAKMFGDLCRRTLRFCDEGQPCPFVWTEGQILLVSSQRGLTSAPHRTAPASQPSPEARPVSLPGRSGGA
jgi:hypothetical protein